MSSSHLGERLSVFVDGALAPTEHDSVVAHLALCQQCRTDVEVERELKVRLTCISTPPPGDALMARLLGLAGPIPPLPPVDVSLPPVAVQNFHGRRSPMRPGQRTVQLSNGGRTRQKIGTRGSRGPWSVGAVAAGAAAVTVLVSAFALGGEPSSGSVPTVVPAVAAYVQEHATTVLDTSLSDPGVAVVPAMVSLPGAGQTP